MSCTGVGEGTNLTFFIMYMYLSPLMSEVYLLFNRFEKPIHNAIRRFSCFQSKIVDIFLFLHKNRCGYSARCFK